MTTHTTMVLGGPGCGKTTRLLEIVAKELEAGVSPGQIAFVAYTKAAAEEAKERAAAKFHLDPKRDLPYFRTIHSLAHQQLGVSRDQVMQCADWRQVGLMINERINCNVRQAEGLGSSATQGDRMQFAYDFSRATGQDLEEVLAKMEDGIPLMAMERFIGAVERYKEEKGKLDFTDMLLRYAAGPYAPVPVKVAVVDEAQDLTHAQWQVVDRAFREVERLYIGGDDDQAIYRWNGADVERFLHQSAAERVVLPLSHRLPQKIFAVGQQVALRISERYEKPYAPAREGGEVHYHGRWLEVPFDRPGSWLVLARNTYMLRDLEGILMGLGWLYDGRWGPSARPEEVAAIYGWEKWRKGQMIEGKDVKHVAEALGVTWKISPARKYLPTDFHLSVPTMPLWHEALGQIPMERRMYYMGALRRGQKLREPARIRLETIHGVKGSEADHVALGQDISARTYASMEKDADSEHRVFYVAVTRAKETLHIVAPSSSLYYTI